MSQDSEDHIDERDGFAHKEVAGEDQVAKEAGGHGDPEFDDMVECKIGDTNHMLWAVPGVVVGVPEAPKELIVVHAAVLEVPSPLEAQHPEAAVADDGKEVEVSHCGLRVAFLLHVVPKHLENGQLEEIEKDDFGLVPEMNLGGS